MKKLIIFICFSIFWGTSIGAEYKKENTHQLTVGTGIFDITKDKYRTWQIEVDYKAKWQWWQIRPQFGITMTGKGAIYLFGGILFDLHWKKIFFLPSFSAGYYNKGSDGKDLGYPLEFKSGIEFGYTFDDNSRVGLNFYHLSNASLSKRNPGVESLILFYGFDIFK